MGRDGRFLQLVRAKQAIDLTPKKVLARRCGVPRPRFSEMLRGEIEMPHSVRRRLVQELGLGGVLDNCQISWASADASADEVRR